MLIGLLVWLDPRNCDAKRINPRFETESTHGVDSLIQIKIPISEKRFRIICIDFSLIILVFFQFTSQVLSLKP